MEQKGCITILIGAKDSCENGIVSRNSGFLAVFGMMIAVSGFLSVYNVSALTVINESKGLFVESKVSTTANTTGNNGSGDIVTGDAQASAIMDVNVGNRSGKMEVSGEAMAEADDDTVSVDIRSTGTPVLERAKSSGASAEVSVSMEEEDTGDISGLPEPSDPPGMMERIFSRIGDFFRSLFR